MVTAVAPKALIEKVQSYLPEDKVRLVEEAYRFAAECHEGQRRQSGGPYIEHPLQTAVFLAELNLDVSTIAASLLHDVVEDCGVSCERIEDMFGDEVAKLVDGVTKLTRMDLQLMGRDKPTHLSTGPDDHLRAESLRKMLVAMAEDVRVVLIKLADRLHNIKTLAALSPDKRRAIAQETLDIYAPLAHRLGIWDIKWRLEDLAFRHMDQTKYRQISRMLSAKRAEREVYIAKVCDRLKTELRAASVEAEVVGRPKHIYSIYRKMQRYASQGKELDKIYDLYALRVLVKTKAECYNALGVVHDLWHPIPGQFDDYIGNPKENRYQSLHSTVMCEGGVPLEVQIRTYDMHQFADYGVAAHWRYKEGSTGDGHFEEKMNWLRQLVEWQRDVSGAEEFLESIKTDIFRDQVFVYSPKGEIIELPSGSTPIDFAYKIHTELGHRCIGGKVNARLVPLDYQLQNGDTVEILTTKVARGPSLDWLNPSLGYVRSASTHAKIRQWFRKQARSSNVQRGKEVLRKELKRLNISLDELEIARMFGYDTLSEFRANLGSGGITDTQLVGKLTANQGKAEEEEHKLSVPLSSPTTGVHVLGVGDLLTRIAMCCGPLPGEEIIGYITRSRGVSVHKRTCPNVLNEDEPERLVKVEWGQTQQLYPVRLTIEAWDRVGLLSDVAALVSQEGVNIAGVVTTENPDGTATMSLTLYTSGVAQLGRLFSKLEGVRGVRSATRSIAADAPDHESASV